jgi:hypothetical protein
MNRDIRKKTKFPEYIEEEKAEKREFISGEVSFSSRQYKDFSSLTLKVNSHKYPLIILPDCRLFLETFSDIYRVAYEFIIKIAEPISRPLYVHEY